MTEKEIEQLADLVNDNEILTEENAELRKMVNGLEKKLGDSEKQCESLEADVAELNSEIHELENRPTNEGVVELVERLADSRNWIDGRYAPAIVELYDNVADLCSAVLRESE